MQSFVDNCREILSNQFVLIALTFIVFFCAKILQRKTGWVLLNPILITIAALIAFLKITGIQYDTYQQAGSQIDFWLKPAIVALGVPLYQQLKVIRKQLVPILFSQTVGCIVGIVSAVTTAQLFGASKEVVISLAPKSEVFLRLQRLSSLLSDYLVLFLGFVSYKLAVSKVQSLKV